MDVLLVLARAGNQVVNREDLVKQVWPRGFVTDAALNRCISNLRAVLGDDHKAPRFIATVPRRGYRLAIPVVVPTPENGEDRVLVLPFQHLADGGEAYLADGLTELLIARLSVGMKQPVISRTTAMSFRRGERDLRSMADQLGVRWVIEGSVLQQGEQVQVVVQLIDARSDSHAWSNSWTHSLGDALTILNEISRQVAARIRTRLDGPRTEPAIIPELPTELLRHYLHGLQLMSRRTHDSLRQAIDCFERVLQRVPDHAPSLSGLAHCWIMMGHYLAVPAVEGFGNARRYAEAAIKVGSGAASADPLICLAAVAFFHEWEFDQAAVLIRDALELDPGHGIGLLLAADLHVVRHDQERAQGFLDRALTLDPLNPGLLMNAGDLLVLQRRFGEAVNALRAALDINPGMRPARLRLAMALAFSGNESDALDCLALAREAGGGDAAVLEYLAIVMGRLGHQSEAMAAAERHAREYKNAPAWSTARAWASAGQTRRAISKLSDAVGERSSSLPFLGVSPVFDALRGEPEVVEIMRQVGVS